MKKQKHTQGEWRVTTFEEHPNKRSGWMIYARGKAGDIAKIFTAGEYAKDNPKDEFEVMPVAWQTLDTLLEQAIAEAS